MSNKKILCLLGLLINIDYVFAASNDLVFDKATTDAAALQQRQQQLLDRQKQLNKLKEKTNVTPLEKMESIKAADLPEVSSTKFLLKGIDFSKSEWLKKEELRSIANKYVGRKLTFSDLNQLVGEVNSLYKSKGVLTAVALLPSQKITDGFLNVNLIEGRIGQVYIEKNKTTRKSFVADRVDLPSGQLLDLKEVERQLIRFNRRYDVQIAAQMDKGKAFGTTDLYFQLQEPQKQVVELFSDNYGSEDTGSIRRGLSYTNNSLWGYRDRLYVSASESSKSKSLAFAYSVYANKSGGLLSFSYLTNKISLPPSKTFVSRIHGYSSVQSVNYSHPILVSKNSKLQVSLAFNQRRSETLLSSIKSQDSEVQTWPLAINWEYLYGSGAIFSGLSATRGKEDAIANEELFTRYNANFTWMNNTPKWTSYLTFSGQFSDDDRLPSGQQFQIGGVSSVRGYDEGLQSGDKGLYVNFEVHKKMPVIYSETFKSPVRITPIWFFDKGVVHQYRPADSQFVKRGHRLTSTGLGLNIDVGSKFHSSLMLGLPIHHEEYKQSKVNASWNVQFRPFNK